MSNKILKFADFKNGNPLQEPKKHALTTKGEPKPKKEKSLDQVKRSNLGQLTVTQPAYSKTVKDPIMEGVIEDNTVKIDDLKIQLSKLSQTDTTYLQKKRDIDDQIAILAKAIEDATKPAATV